MNSDSTAYKLERRRDSLKRARQLWIAGLVIWGVLVGWVVWLFINSLDQDDNIRFAWVAVWLLPVLALAVGTWVTQRRLKACQASLVANERRSSREA